MFDKNKTYWIKFEGSIKKDVNLKVRVLEETEHLIKVEKVRDGGVEVIAVKMISNVNEIRDEFNMVPSNDEDAK
jgi:parvulin-like peptidyl-prolyl isomerase